MGSAFKSTHTSVGPVSEWKLQVQVRNALCIYDFDKLLFKNYFYKYILQ